MTPPLTISSSVIDRLQYARSNTTGRLYGVMYDNTLTVLSFAVNKSDQECCLEPTDLQPNMPAEIDLCGVLFIGEGEEPIPAAFKDIDITDNPLLIKYSLKDANVQAYYYVHEVLQSAQKVEIISEEDIWERFFYIRVQTCFPIVTTKEEVEKALQETRKNIASGIVAFGFSQKNFYLFDTDSDSKNVSIKDELASNENLLQNQKNHIAKNVPEITEAIPARMLWGTSRDKAPESTLKCAPALHHIKRSFESLQFDLQIDALSVVGNNVTAANLYAILVESVCRNIRLIERSFVEQMKESDELRLPVPLHFKPRACGHLITVTYPVGKPDEKLYDYRKSLHKALALDLTRPYFRRSNVVKFSSDLTSNEPLLNPHVAIVSPPSDRKIATVDGLYAYHHYMQDSFDDNGWGCAYRSLQTIVSWFRLQGYTNVDIPSHRDVQKCLVEIGDKPSNFIDSKQWIGSTEVGFVLETLLGITVRILCASNGEEMSDLASDLAHHFETQGTPVMIGGGVLAHTILGISYNETYDDIKYLILDPHYTGAENLSVILNKGWCGWKNKDFWKKDAFYNMCLPQRPVII
ncbi:ufm1-specific protease 2 isoform X2 [Venturia canescens]|uniref:ufm1-specific protease 2 isoform X2 n=1 Tax=Venturia canescens TaxID=32260 RepID=UPI001C9CDDA6|nr:ufm1-specific protease 2 isoform X2 [Venturia canescens]